MHSTLIVARIAPGANDDVAALFRDFDATEMPHLMGTRRRQLFQFGELYFHVQDFDQDNGGEVIQGARSDPRFVKISDDLKPFIQPYDPATWRTPADAMAARFYLWEASA